MDEQRAHLAAVRDRLPVGAEPTEAHRADVTDLRQQQLAEAWALSIPSRFAWAQVCDVAEPHRERLNVWGGEPIHGNLAVVGPTGAGKTHAAVAAVRLPFMRGMDVEFWPTVELLDQLRPGGDPNLFEDLWHLDLLILDDIGAERTTDWTMERLYALVNRRWLEERPTVLTTNLGPEALAESVGERTTSRLFGNGTTVVKLSGTDRRFDA